MSAKHTSTVSTRLFVATIAFFFFLSGTALCILASTFAVTINYSMNSSWIAFIFLVFLFSLTCAILLIVTRKKNKNKKRKPEKNSGEKDNENAAMKAKASNSADDDDDDDDSSDDDDLPVDDDQLRQKPNSSASVRDSVIARMNQNLVRIKEYYKWSQDQAKAMFIVAVSTCIAGFVMIVASLLLSIFLKLDFEAALFTAIGGMVTEVFGGTTLLVYRSTVSQLNYYHKSLHEDQRYLYSAELTEEINSSAIKDEMLEAIIRNALRLNIILAQEKEETTEKKKSSATENEQQGATSAS